MIGCDDLQYRCIMLVLFKYKGGRIIFTNAYYDTRNSKIHLWETIKGERFHDIIEWTPFVFLKHHEDKDIKTIDGIPVGRRTFNDYDQYKSFMSKNKDCFENEVNPVIQFLSERYHKISDEEIDVPNLVIHFEDIEVQSSMVDMDKKIEIRFR